MKEEKENLLSRKVYTFEIVYSGQATPSNETVHKQLTEKTKADTSLIKIKSIKPLFGEGKANVTAYIYDSKEAMDKFEGKVKQKTEEKPKEEVKK